MKKVIILILGCMLLHISCTDRNVKKVSSKIYEVDGVYIKRVKIGGDKIYFIVDGEGNLIAGASATSKFEHHKNHTASIIPPKDF